MADLTGSWILESYKITGGPEDVYPLGEDAQGVLIFSPSGAVSTTIQRKGLKHHEDKNPLGGSVEERAISAAGTIAYAGTFTTEAKGDKTLIKHNITVSTYPNWVGLEMIRVATVTGDKLVIEPEAPVTFNGDTRHGSVTWVRK